MTEPHDSGAAAIGGGTAAGPDEVPDRKTVLASAAFGALMLVGAVLVIVDALRLPKTSEA